MKEFSGIKRGVGIMLLVLFAFSFVPAKLKAQENKKTRILFLFDLSGSMWGEMKGGKRKVDVAKAILSRLADSLDNVENLELALRAYGHTAKRNKQDCKDTRLEVPFAAHNGQNIKQRIAQLQPSGTTPIAYSLSEASLDFPNKRAKNIIILITDGIEECNGDPCAVSQALQASNIIVRPFIIGLGMNEDYGKYFECVGRYFSAETENDFRSVLSSVITQALNNTTLQVNLNNISGKPTQTNINMTFYNAKTGVVENDYYNTFNHLGRPDTFTMDPLIRYNIVVQSTPPVTKNNIVLKSAQHNIVDISVPIGSLNLSVNAIDYFTLKALVKKAGQNEIIYVQDFNTTKDYLVGSYDLEVLTLPRVTFTNVQVTQSKTTKIVIPEAGKVELQYKKNLIASLYVLRNNKEEWITDLKGGDMTSKDLYYLQPGNYKVVYRPRDSYNTLDSREKTFKMTSGSYISVILD